MKWWDQMPWSSFSECWALSQLFHSPLSLSSSFSSVQFSSVAQSFPTLCDPMDCSKAGLPVHHKLMSIEWVMPSNHLILCCPLLLPPSIFPSIRVFSNESVLHSRWPKYWSFSFNISPSNEYSGLISFRMDWLDLLAVQGTQESSPTPQFKSINSSALSLLYGPTLNVHTWLTTGKAIALTIRTSVSEVMSLLFNMLSRLVIAFLPRNKCLLISWPC